MWNQTTIQGVVFDMDGVLVNTSPCHAQAYEKLWKKLAIQGPEYSIIAGRSTKEVIAEYAAHLSGIHQQNAVEFKQATALTLLEAANVGFADTYKALEALHALGLPMAVATSASKASADLVLRRLDIHHLFQIVITSEDVLRAKPAPDLFLAAIAALGLNHKDAIILEDSRSGIEAALASGAHTVSVRDAEALPEILTSAPKYLGHLLTVLDVAQTIIKHSQYQCRQSATLTNQKLTKPLTQQHKDKA